MTASTLPYVKNPCTHCGHDPDDHRFDDERLPEFEGMPQELLPFRCLGPELAGCAQACPAFEGEPLTWKEGFPS